MPGVSFDDLALALEHTQCERLEVTYLYETVTLHQETRAYTLVNRSDRTLKVLALPPLPRRVETGLVVTLDGRSATTLPLEVVKRTTMSALRCAGAGSRAVGAVGRHIWSGAPLPREARGSVGAALRSVPESQRAALARLLVEAERDKYVPFVCSDGGVAPGEYVVVTFCRRGDDTRGRPKDGIERSSRPRAALLGEWRLRKRLPLGRKYALHVYLRPPSGSWLAGAAAPSHWIGVSSHEPNLWHFHMSLDEKEQVWAKGFEEDRAAARFATPALLHGVLACAFALLTAVSWLLGGQGSERDASKLLAVHGLVAALVLPLVWEARLSDLQLAHLSASGLLAVLLASAWLVALAQGWPTGWLVLLGAMAASWEGTLAALRAVTRRNLGSAQGQSVEGARPGVPMKVARPAR